MFSSLAVDLWHKIALDSVYPSLLDSISARLVVTLGSLWLSWRIWTFSILPAFYPDEPKQIPYWMPYLGHALAFFKDFNDLVAYGRHYLQNTYEPFALTIAGERIYIVTRPEDVSEVYKNNTTLEFDTHVQDLFKSFDGSSAGLKKLQTPYRDPKQLASNKSNSFQSSATIQDSVGLFIRQSYKQQLQPGGKLDILEAKILRSFERSIDALVKQCKSSASSEGESLSILQWTKYALLDAGTAALYGEQLIQIEPDFIQHYLAFDNNSWMLLYHYPAFLSDAVNVPKRKVLDAFTAYFHLPLSKRPEVAQFLQTIEGEQRKLDLEDRDISSSAFIFYWAINSNPWKLCFWVMVYTLFDPELHSLIQTETKPAIRQGTVDIDMQHLTDNCPHLEAVFNEALRLVAASTSIRNVIQPTTVNGKVFRAGSKVLMPYRPMHFNESIFGPHTDVFDANRFYNNPSLGRSSSFRPWGGGSTFCPGRFLARREIYAFIALTLHHFDIRLVDGQKFPRRDEVTPNLGIMEPMRGDDLMVIARPVVR